MSNIIRAKYVSSCCYKRVKYFRVLYSITTIPSTIVVVRRCEQVLLKLLKVVLYFEVVVVIYFLPHLLFKKFKVISPNFSSTVATVLLQPVVASASSKQMLSRIKAKVTILSSLKFFTGPGSNWCGGGCVLLPSEARSQERAILVPLPACSLQPPPLLAAARRAAARHYCWCRQGGSCPLHQE